MFKHVFFLSYSFFMTITLDGETPSKKNSRINTRSGRSFPNARYRKWHEQAVGSILLQIAERKISRIADEGSLRLTVTFFHGDMKRRDSDNQLSSVLDTLVDAGILSDDNWKVLPEKHIYNRYDKGNARCVVELEKIEQEDL